MCSKKLDLSIEQSNRLESQRMLSHILHSICLDTRSNALLDHYIFHVKTHARIN